MKRIALVVLVALSLVASSALAASPILFNVFIPSLGHRAASNYGFYRVPSDGKITAIYAGIGRFAIGCRQSPVIFATYGDANPSHDSDLTIENLAFTESIQNLSIPLAQGTPISVFVVTIASGCKKVPSDINVTIEFTPDN